MNVNVNYHAGGMLIDVNVKYNYIAFYNYLVMKDSVTLQTWL